MRRSKEIRIVEKVAPSVRNSSAFDRLFRVRGCQNRLKPTSVDRARTISDELGIAKHAFPYVRVPLLKQSQHFAEQSL